jgi:hypothetical protein
MHALCFVAVLLFSLFLIAYNLFHTSQNNRFSLSAFLKPQTLWSILSYRDHPGFTCNLPSPGSVPAWITGAGYQLIAPLADPSKLLLSQSQNGLWSIVIADNDTKTLQTLVSGIDFPGSTLVTAYAPIERQFMYPDCTNHLCYIYTYDLATGSKNKVPALISADKLPTPHIRNVFFDEKRGLVSYGVSQNPLSARVVINTREELIQTITENLSPSRRLSFKGYLPQTGFLVYTDPVNQMTDFYRAGSIGLYRTRCPKLL